MKGGGDCFPCFSRSHVSGLTIHNTQSVKGRVGGGTGDDLISLFSPSIFSIFFYKNILSQTTESERE